MSPVVNSMPLFLAVRKRMRRLLPQLIHRAVMAMPLHAFCRTTSMMGADALEMTIMRSVPFFSARIFSLKLIWQQMRDVLLFVVNWTAHKNLFLVFIFLVQMIIR